MKITTVNENSFRNHAGLNVFITLSLIHITTNFKIFFQSFNKLCENGQEANGTMRPSCLSLFC